MRIIKVERGKAGFAQDIFLQGKEWERAGA